MIAISHHIGLRLYQPLTMISLDRIGDIHTFVQIVQAGNLSAAAQRLDLSLAAVSKRLSRLERALGCRLLERTTRRSCLTEAGRDFYHHGVALLGHAERAQKAVQSRQRGMRGLLKVGSSAAFARHQIVPRLARLLARHPALKIELVGLDDSTDRPHPDIDVAICWQSPAPRPGLTSLELGLDQLVLCASPAYLEQYGRPRTPADLSSHRWVLCGSPTKHGWPPAPEHSGDFSDVEWSTQTSNRDLAQTAALAGLGIAAQSLRDAADALSDGRLEEVLRDGRPAPEPIFASWPTEAETPRLQGFVHFLKEELSAAVWPLASHHAPAVA